MYVYVAQPLLFMTLRSDRPAAKHFP